MAQLMSILRHIAVEPLMFAYMICLYYLVPAVSSLYLYKVCLSIYKYNRSECDDLVSGEFNQTSKAEDLVSSETSRWMFYQTVLFVIPSVSVTLLMGVYTDKKGHRISLALPFVGQTLGCIWYLLMSYYSDWHVSYMLLGPILTGISGGFATVIMSSFSYLTIVSSTEYRTVRVTLLQGIMSLGTFIASFTVGSILNQSDFIQGWMDAFIAIIVLSVVNIIYILIRFRDTSYMIRAASLDSEDRPLCEFPARCSVILAVMRVACSAFPSLLQLTLAAIMMLWVTGLGRFDVLYTFSQRMKLNRTQYGYYTGYDAAAQAVAGIFAGYVLKRILRWRDTSVAILGMVSSILCLFCLGISGFTQPGSKAFLVLWWISPAVGMFQLTSGPALRSIASEMVLPSSQAKLFSFISSSDGILQLVTSGVYQYGLWPLTEKEAPGISFFVSAFLASLGIIFTSIVRIRRDKHSKEREHLIDRTPESTDLPSPINSESAYTT